MVWCLFLFLCVNRMYTEAKKKKHGVLWSWNHRQLWATQHWGWDPGPHLLLEQQAVLITKPLPSPNHPGFFWMKLISPTNIPLPPLTRLPSLLIFLCFLLSISTANLSKSRRHSQNVGWHWSSSTRWINLPLFNHLQWGLRAGTKGWQSLLQKWH